jgi:transcriptional regulator with XRE-family HTH domain
MSRFGENFARVLGLHGLTGRQAARLLGVSEQAVSEWLTGKREPGTSSLVQIASSFEIDALRLMNEPFVAVLPQLADPDRFDRVEKRLNGFEWVQDKRGYGYIKRGVRAKSSESSTLGESSTVTELTERRR